MTKEQLVIFGHWKDVFNQARQSTKPIKGKETPETIAAAAISAGMIVAVSKIAEIFTAQKP
jgi:hypothetical protein